MTATQPSARNLEEYMAARHGPVSMLRNSQLGSYVFPGIPPEFTDWRDEQRSWRETCALLSLSYHQTYLSVIGPDAKRLLDGLAINRFDNFHVNRGKQLVTCGPDGFIIGDGICLHLEEEVYRISGAPMISNWIQFNAEISGLNVRCERDEVKSLSAHEPRTYVFQIQGPNAQQLMIDVTGQSLPEIGFFHLGSFEIAGCHVRALRHGMAGQPGYEIFGPWSDHATVLAALEEAGARHKMRKIGGLAYPTTSIESAWMSLPLPAIYHSEEMKPYREWLGLRNLEVVGSLGGSFVSEDIEDYYIDPIEIGYGHLVDRTGEFVGSEAIKQRAADQKRAKVTLVWDQDDAAAVMRSSLFDGSSGAKFVDTPLSRYATYQYDSVTSGGRNVGLARLSGYSANAGEFLSVSLIEKELSEPGTKVSLMWGEPNSTRPVVEKHQVREIRATVAPAPYFHKKIADQGAM